MSFPEGVGMTLSRKINRLVVTFLCGIMLSIASLNFGFADEIENMNCPSASCTTPYLKVKAKTHGIVYAACTDISLPKISIECHWKANVLSSSDCTKEVVSAPSSMKCDCYNRTPAMHQVRAQITCSAE